MSDVDGVPDKIEYLAAFEREFQGASRPILGDWVIRWPEPERRTEIASILFEAAAERCGYDIGWLREQCRDDRVPKGVWQSRELLRTIYGDQADKQQQPRWDDYAAFSLPPDELLLRTDKDRCYLGQVVAAQYRLVRRLGAGGLGVVYEARDAEGKNAVAIKVPLEAKNRKPYDEALRKEASLLKRFDCHGTPRFLDVLETSDGPLLVSQLVKGRSLEEFGRLDSAEALRVVSQVAATLDSLHQGGNIHGDVKPDNLLVDEDGAVTLIDFNVARPDDPTDGFPGGTLPFMSPEAVLGVGADVDLRQDIYALGSLLYQLVTGKPLTSPECKEEAVVMSVLVGGAHEPEFPEDVPHNLQRICQAAISRQPLSRFETAGDFRESCQAILEGEGDALNIPPQRPKLHAWRLGTALGCLAVRQRRITTELSESAEPSIATIQKLAPYLAGVTAAIDDAVPLAERLGVSITAWEGADAYQTLVYRLRKLKVEDVEQLKLLAIDAEQWARDSLETAQEHLTASSPECAALYLAAVQSRFAPYSWEAAKRWPRAAAPAKLPGETIANFAAGCQEKDPSTDWGAQLKQLDYAVVRWLRWEAS